MVSVRALKAASAAAYIAGKPSAPWAEGNPLSLFSHVLASPALLAAVLGKVDPSRVPYPLSMYGAPLVAPQPRGATLGAPSFLTSGRRSRSHPGQPLELTQPHPLALAHARVEVADRRWRRQVESCVAAVGCVVK